MTDNHNIDGVRREWRTPSMPKNLDELEQDVARIAQQPQAIDDLGRMSAEAVMQQFETTAAAFGAMGEEVKSRIAKLNASLQEADASMKLLAEASNAIKEQGKLAYTRIEEMSSVAKLIRDLHGEVLKKIG